MSRFSLGNVLRGRARPETKALDITPQRTGERNLLSAENMLGSIAVPEPFCLEIVGDAAGVTLLARCHDGSFVKQQVGVNYPQARVNEVPPEDDPLRLAEGEQAWSMDLRLRGPEYLPLKSFRDDDLLDPGSDPLLSVIGAMSDLGEGERLVSRMKLLSLGPDWARQHQERAQHRQPAAPATSPQSGQDQFNTKQAASFIILGVAALIGLRGYFWVRDGETWKAVLLGMGTAAALAVAGWAWWRIKRFLSGDGHQDPLMIKEKLSRPAYHAQLEVIAILPERGTEQRSKDILRNVNAAYAHYNNPAGASFKATKVRPIVPITEVVAPATGLFQGRDVLGVREAATLWHPPGPGDQLHTVSRSGSRVLQPPVSRVAGGAPVGDTVGGKPRPVLFSPDTNGHHHLYVARTRMGKSTLMHNVALHRMREKAAGRDDDAIIVVDPHADLVAGLLEHVPEEIIDRVHLIDLADNERVPGINLLDARVFPDRDRTADSVVRIAHGLWEQWGPRMQSILEHTVKALHEYNRHPDTREEQQLTILDGQRMLADLEFRKQVLKRVDDAYINDWWFRDLPGWSRDTRSDAMSPVQTRLGYYSSSRKARAILGQPVSTIDLRKVIAEGGVLLVSTSQATAGRDVSALVGASLLNLVDAVIREQGSLPPEERRGGLVVVDEMQTMPGVDYESMLSELGKFGANFILATQSLAKLEDLSRTMRDTVLANVGCLAAFQMAGTDARQLVWELGKERVSEDDVTSLDVHQCYVRATVGVERMDAFSMRVLPPEPGDPAVARRIRDLALGYLTPWRTSGFRTTNWGSWWRSTARNWRNSGRVRASAGSTRPARRPSPGPPTGATREASDRASRRPDRRRKPMRKGSRTMTRNGATVGKRAAVNRTARGRWRNDTEVEPEPGRVAAPAGPDALPGPAGTGCPGRPVPGRGLRGGGPAGGCRTSRLSAPRRAVAGPHPPVLPHRTGRERAGPGGGPAREQPAPGTSAIVSLAAGPAGTAGRRRRHLPPGLRPGRPGPSRRLPLAPGAAPGRNSHPAR